VDFIEVTPFRTRVEAETGRWSGASRVTVDMSESNFFPAYFSGAAFELPAGTSIITLAKGHPDHPGEVQPGTVDLDYVEVELAR
jgi:hypothetical protein